MNILTNPTNGVAVNLLVNPSEQERAALVKELVDYNQSKAGPRQFSQFGIFARGPAQELMGGLLGYISWKWLSIEVFWVAESARRLGVGGRLLHKAEEFALRQDCRFAHVETYSFQARGFYEKHGYRLFAELENYPIGHQCYYLRKALAAGLAGFSADDIKRAGVSFAQKDKNLVVTWPQAKDVSASHASLRVQAGSPNCRLKAPVRPWASLVIAKPGGLKNYFAKRAPSGFQIFIRRSRRRDYVWKRGNRHYVRKATPESLGNGRRPFEPSPDTPPAYDLYYKIYRTIYESLKALFSQLAETRNLALEH